MQNSNVKAEVKLKYNQIEIGELTNIEVTDLGFLKLKAFQDGQYTNIIVGKVEDLELINSKLKFELIEESITIAEPISESTNK